jgi:hypothetical protein
MEGLPSRATSDQKKLVFYVKWQDTFPDAAGLLMDGRVGYVLPNHVVPRIVQSGIREKASELNVVIELISDPRWR